MEPMGSLPIPSTQAPISNPTKPLSSKPYRPPFLRKPLKDIACPNEEFSNLKVRLGRSHLSVEGLGFESFIGPQDPSYSFELEGTLLDRRYEPQHAPHPEPFTPKPIQHPGTSTLNHFRV